HGLDALALQAVDQFLLGFGAFDFAAQNDKISGAFRRDPENAKARIGRVFGSNILEGVVDDFLNRWRSVATGAGCRTAEESAKAAKKQQPNKSFIHSGWQHNGWANFRQAR